MNLEIFQLKNRKKNSNISYLLSDLTIYYIMII